MLTLQHFLCFSSSDEYAFCFKHVLVLLVLYCILALAGPVQTSTFDLYALLIELYHFCEKYLTGLYKTLILQIT